MGGALYGRIGAEIRYTLRARVGRSHEFHERPSVQVNGPESGRTR